MIIAPIAWFREMAHENYGEAEANLAVACLGGLTGIVLFITGIIMAEREQGRPCVAEKPEPPSRSLCPDCGCQVADGSKTCPWCGADQHLH